jgi:RNA polymerase sigma-54 factor
MLLQLNAADPDRDDIAVLLTEHLEELARNRLPQVAKALELSTAAVVQLVARVRELNPRPAAAVRAGSQPPARIELEAALEGGQVVVRLCGGELPELAVSPRYAALARGGDAALRRYLRPKIAAARGLIRALGHRQRTLLAVAAAILQRQAPFLEHGVRQMRALRMADVAAALGCHTSTVSRAIAGKWVATAHGAFALRAFFDGAHLGAAQAASAPRLGQRGVQARIRDLIAGEAPDRPLSDDELLALLRSEGIRVARRTVAKYRADLGLPSQWQRRSHVR